MKSLHGKTVAITGAASGIGRALAVACASRGASIAITDVDVAGLEETAALARVHGHRVDTRKVDVGVRAEIYAWAKHVEERLGGADVLVNNAGVSLSHSIENMSDDDFEWLFNVNFWGVANGCKAFLPQLRARPEAHVVNLSSVFGLIAVPTQSAYNAAKFAVRGYTEALRQELRRTNVRVTCVHPGGIRTNITRRGRHYEDPLGNPTDTAKTSAQFERSARTSPERAAEAIVNAILKEQPRLLIGADAHVIDWMVRLAPAGYTAVIDRLLRLRANPAK